MSSAANSLAWCQKIIEGLRGAGVSDLVVSPGSRSTPLLLAAIDSSLTLHSVVDERSAAFFALGRARVSESPVALLCTSGTAGAHWLPALLEARYAGHRLVAMTADRPAELHGLGANQTIEQTQLFASACPPCLDLGAPIDSSLALRSVALRVHQAVAQANGPIHLNLPFRKPLEPSEADRAQIQDATPLGEVTCSTLRSSDSVLEALASRCKSAKRGLIVAGPSVNAQAGAVIIELAQNSGFVLLAESASGARFHANGAANRCDAFPHLLANADDTLHPDLILRFGLEPVSPHLNRWLQQLEVPSIQFCQRRTINPSGCSQDLVYGDIADTARRLGSKLKASESSYLQNWRLRDEQAWAVVREKLQASAFGEAHAVSSIVRSLPTKTQLTIGNSLPIRMIDAVVPGSRAQLRVLHQRGVSGIDGLIAGAIGSSGDQFSALLLGDVSCNHDLSSLALAVHARGPLAIIVIDNEGGQIFKQLPVATQAMSSDSWDLWRTPPNIDLQAVARGYGVSYQRAGSDIEISRAIEQATRAHCTLIHVPVPASSARDFLSRCAR